MEKTNKMANGTQTSSFGVSARLNHDSSKFYNSKMYKKINGENNFPHELFEEEKEISKEFLNHIIKIMDELGFLMRGEIIWDKSSSAGSSTAWGSWQSAKNPTLRDVHEYILIFSKDNYSRSNKKKDTISKDEFMEFTKSIWTFSATSARKIGHPAPFPEELPRRLIELYSFEGDVILDPFIGSGQTAIASIKTKRNYVGYDIDKSYCELAEKRIKEIIEQTKLS